MVYRTLSESHTGLWERTEKTGGGTFQKGSAAGGFSDGGGKGFLPAQEKEGSLCGGRGRSFCRFVSFDECLYPAVLQQRCLSVPEKYERGRAVL